METKHWKIGDLVWSRVQGHGSWPGQVMDPKVNRKDILKSKKTAPKDAILVSYFGDSTFGWVHPLNLDDFGQFYEIKKDQVQGGPIKQKVFRTGVEEAKEILDVRSGRTPVTAHEPADFTRPETWTEDLAIVLEKFYPPGKLYPADLVSAGHPSTLLKWLKSAASSPPSRAELDSPKFQSYAKQLFSFRDYSIPDAATVEKDVPRRKSVAEVPKPLPTPAPVPMGHKQRLISKHSAEVSIASNDAAQQGRRKSAGAMEATKKHAQRSEDTGAAQGSDLHKRSKSVDKAQISRGAVGGEEAIETPVKKRGRPFKVRSEDEPTKVPVQHQKKKDLNDEKKDIKKQIVSDSEKAPVVHHKKKLISKPEDSHGVAVTKVNREEVAVTKAKREAEAVTKAKREEVPHTKAKREEAAVTAGDLKAVMAANEAKSKKQAVSARPQPPADAPFGPSEKVEIQAKDLFEMTAAPSQEAVEEAEEEEELPPWGGELQVNLAKVPKWLRRLAVEPENSLRLLERAQPMAAAYLRYRESAYYRSTLRRDGDLDPTLACALVSCGALPENYLRNAGYAVEGAEPEGQEEEAAEEKVAVPEDDKKMNRHKRPLDAEAEETQKPNKKMAKETDVGKSKKRVGGGIQGQWVPADEADQVGSPKRRQPPTTKRSSGLGGKAGEKLLKEESEMQDEETPVLRQRASSEQKRESNKLKVEVGEKMQQRNKRDQDADLGSGRGTPKDLGADEKPLTRRRSFEAPAERQRDSRKVKRELDSGNSSTEEDDEFAVPSPSPRLAKKAEQSAFETVEIEVRDFSSKIASQAMFESELQRWHGDRSSEMNLPLVSFRTWNPFEVFSIVAKHGGYEACCQGLMWGQVAKQWLGEEFAGKGSVESMKKGYKKTLLAFEKYLAPSCPVRKIQIKRRIQKPDRIPPPSINPTRLPLRDTIKREERMRDERMDNRPNRRSSAQDTYSDGEDYRDQRANQPPIRPGSSAEKRRSIEQIARRLRKDEDVDASGGYDPTSASTKMYSTLQDYDELADSGSRIRGNGRAHTVRQIRPREQSASNAERLKIKFPDGNPLPAIQQLMHVMQQFGDVQSDDIEMQHTKYTVLVKFPSRNELLSACDSLSKNGATELGVEHVKVSTVGISDQSYRPPVSTSGTGWQGARAGQSYRENTSYDNPSQGYQRSGARNTFALPRKEVSISMNLPTPLPLEAGQPLRGPGSYRGSQPHMQQHSMTSHLPPPPPPPSRMNPLPMQQPPAFPGSFVMVPSAGGQYTIQPQQMMTNVPMQRVHLTQGIQGILAAAPQSMPSMSAPAVPLLSNPMLPTTMQPAAVPLHQPAIAPSVFQPPPAPRPETVSNSVDAMRVLQGGVDLAALLHGILPGNSFPNYSNMLTATSSLPTHQITPSSAPEASPPAALPATVAQPTSAGHTSAPAVTVAPTAAPASHPMPTSSGPYGSGNMSTAAVLSKANLPSSIASALQAALSFAPSGAAASHAPTSHDAPKST